MICENILPFYGLSFHFLGVLGSKKVVNLSDVQFFSFMVCAFRNNSPPVFITKFYWNTACLSVYVLSIADSSYNARVEQLQRLAHKA